MTLSGLDRKLVRDLWRLRGQAIAVAMVIGCGLAMMIVARSLIFSLDTARSEYYEGNRFAEVFAQLTRAPNSIALRIAGIPGVATVQTGVSVRATLDLPGLDEPASGNLRSFPDAGMPELNRLTLRAGRWLAPRGRREVLVGEPFAEANQLHPGDNLSMLLNGRRMDLRIVGIVLSPEFIFEARPGAALPNNRSYGIFWMPYQELASAFDMHGAFNDVCLTLAPGASEGEVISAVDRLLSPYGGRGAYGRDDHSSNVRVSDEIRALTIQAVVFPLIFLSVAAFMANAVLSRLLNLQREQIAILKAFGYANRQVVWHYLKFAMAIVAGGTIVGTAGGLILGQQLVTMFHKLFRFPQLDFHLDSSALFVALLVSALAAGAGVFKAVRNAARLPPAEAMRPEPPANYRVAMIERIGIAKLLPYTFRIAMRNLERRPTQALFTISGLALATSILIVPSSFRDAIAEVLGLQWDVAQRQDVSVGLVQPGSAAVMRHLRQLPGVIQAEPYRVALVRIHFGERRRQVGLQGLPAGGQLNRVTAAGQREIILAGDGIVISEKLAEVLEVKVGDEVRVESLEDRRLTRTVRLAALAEDFAGLAAYMDLHALNRLLGEGDIVTSASFTVDRARREAFLQALKGIPRVGAVAIKESLRQEFQNTTAAMMNLIQGVYLILATIVAFGVVYNNAQISLAERARELATLRVIGFSRREVGAVLITELVALALIAVPLGLLLGAAFSAGIVSQVSTEAIRLPLVLTAQNYATAVLIVTIASVTSALFVLRKLDQLNLIGALRAPE